VPRENLELMAGQFLLHLTGLAGLALVACAVVGVSEDLRHGLSPGRLLVGALLVLAVAGYTAKVVRAVPGGALRYLRSRVVRDRRLVVTLLLATGSLTCAVLAALAPWGGSLAIGALRPLGLLAVVVGVQGLVRRRP
jgi:hypothetical protein